MRGVLQPATLDDVVAFVVDNGANKGAARHLEQCGFIISGGSKPSYKAVSQAITLIYNHFDEFLSNEEKTRLGFNYDFIENLLCKGSRWVNAGSSVHGDGKGKAVKKAGLARSIAEMAGEVTGSPIPLFISEEKLEQFDVVSM